MLGSSHPGCDIDLTPDTGSIYIVTTEPDTLFERVIAAGASVVRGLRDEDYGSRGFTVRDPQAGFLELRQLRRLLVPPGRYYAGHRPELAVWMRC